MRTRGLQRRSSIFWRAAPPEGGGAARADIVMATARVGGGKGLGWAV